MSTPNTLVRVPCKFGVDRAATASYGNHYGSKGPSSQLYHYIADAALGIKKGDLVVVITPTHGYTVVTVIGDPEPWIANAGGYKWIVDRVDTDAHTKMLEREIRRKELQKQLQEKVELARRKVEIKDLLADDEEAMNMLKELEELK